jgi:hypothetical protein
LRAKLKKFKTNDLSIKKHATFKALPNLSRDYIEENQSLRLNQRLNKTN